MSRDEPTPVRAEDAFDVGALHAWLAERVAGLTGPPEVRQFSGGASNLTYLLRYPERDLVLRRPPAGQKAATAHDMVREHRVQAALAPHYRYVPSMVALCTDPAVLGSDFYVMERVRGTILRGRLPEGMALTPEQAHELGLRAFDALLELHAVDVDAAGLADLGKGRGYVGRQVAGWSERFRRARTDNVPDVEAVMAWLAAHQPDDVATVLVHNDFRLDNLVLDDDLRVVGVLDWEMATLGDPLMDLGGALAYWVQADDDEMFRVSKRQPSDLPGMPTRAQLVARYAERTGVAVGDWTFYEVFGLFRLAVIAQQIYYRFHHGQTSNPAFKDFWVFVTYLDERCRRVAGLAG
jgi:aminoglycoside phosphotransferase (APT) family kinase protein